MKIFSEIYGTYFRITSKILSEAYTDDKTVRDIIMKEGFRDSVLFLPQKLIPGSEDWGLLERLPDGRLKRIIKNKPVEILTSLQKSWLKAKISDPRIRLFMDDDTISRLDEKLADVKPLFLSSQFRATDRFSDHDDYEDEAYREHFRQVLAAVKKRSIAEVEYVTGHGRTMRGKLVMLKIEYSPKNDKFRVYSLLLRHDRIRSSGIVNIGRITYIKDTGRVFRTPFSIDDYFSSRKCTVPAVVRVTTARNGIERFMMEFAAFEKHTVRDLETGECTVELWYDVQDETELLIRLLSYGPVVEILSPPALRKQAKERIGKQYSLLCGFNKTT